MSGKDRKRLCRAPGIVKLNFNKALSYAFLLLRFRLRTQEEMIRRLKEKGASASVVVKVIDYLKGCGYLDDKKFIKDYLEASLEKGWGPVRVDFNLKKLGVSDKLRAEAVKATEAQSKSLIKELLDEKIFYLVENNPFLDKKKIKEKTVRFLANKGHNYKDIYRQLNKYFKKYES